MSTGLNSGAPPLLELRDVTKSFGAVAALSSGNLVLDSGSIHALVGENGAGKSTLVKIIAGLYQRDSGEFLLRGEPTDFRSTADANDAGIAVIYQEPTLFPDLSVSENIFVGRQPYGRFGRIDRAAMRRETRELTDRLGVKIDPDRIVRGFSIADQQVLEIVKAISRDARVLIMDEPTAALSGVEVDRLMAIVRSLRDEGRGILFISHRFDEVFALCDAITVMRDGAFVSQDPIDSVTEDEIIRRMVGRSISNLFPKEEAEIGETLLTVSNLTSAGVFSDIGFSVRAGEIVCLAGLVGAEDEIARAVFGVDGYDSGAVEFLGTPIPRRNPTAAMRSGLGFVPEDRRNQGLLMNASVQQNITLSIRKQLSRGGILTSRMEVPAAQTWMSQLQVKTHAMDTEATMLSGGNQQKIVLGKWLATKPKLLIIDEPTRGIDVGTKSEVHRLISQLAKSGVGILMISSELPEVLGMADRILVIREGRLTAEIDRVDATAETVMYAATHAREE